MELISFILFTTVFIVTPIQAEDKIKPVPPILFLPPNFEHVVDIQGRVIGGQQCTVSYLCSVIVTTNQGGALCSGSIICENYVLTAAHCTNFPGAQILNFTVFCGNNKWYLPQNEDGVNHGILVQEVIPFPYSSPDTFPYGDLALLRLSESLPIPKRCHKHEGGDEEYVDPGQYDPGQSELTPFNGIVSKVHLASSQFCFNMPLIYDAKGWGVISESPLVLPRQANCAEGLKLIADEVCAAYYGAFIPYGIVCTLNNGTGGGLCFGDSGGPSVHRVNGQVTQFGLASFGSGAGCRLGPVGLTQVPCYFDWIEYEIRQRPSTPCHYCPTHKKHGDGYSGETK